LAPEHQLPARILIADDNSIARTTIRALLDWHSFQVCGEAKNGKEAIEKVIELKPDIILLDINMPELNGVKAAYEIRRVSPSTKIVFLTVHDTPGTKQITKMWSHGFVAKSAAGTELIPTLDRLTAKPDEKAPHKAAKSKSRAASGAG
jgi:YesN/AraC family two-component response regulator